MIESYLHTYVERKGHLNCLEITGYVKVHTVQGIDFAIFKQSICGCLILGICGEYRQAGRQAHT